MARRALPAELLRRQQLHDQCHVTLAEAHHFEAQLSTGALAKSFLSAAVGRAETQAERAKRLFDLHNLKGEYTDDRIVDLVAWLQRRLVWLPVLGHCLSLRDLPESFDLEAAVTSPHWRRALRKYVKQSIGVSMLQSLALELPLLLPPAQVVHSVLKKSTTFFGGKMQKDDVSLTALITQAIPSLEDPVEFRASRLLDVVALRQMPRRIGFFDPDRIALLPPNVDPSDVCDFESLRHEVLDKKPLIADDSPDTDRGFGSSFANEKDLIRVRSRVMADRDDAAAEVQTCLYVDYV
jgi:hypothetical protein